MLPENLDILIPQWYRQLTGTFLPEEDEEKFNQNNKFLQLDRRRRKKNNEPV